MNRKGSHYSIGKTIGDERTFDSRGEKVGGTLHIDNQRTQETLESWGYRYKDIPVGAT